MLPPGISSRIIRGVNGLDVHVLEAGKPGQPLALLLHGFPELSYSWRRVMPALAAAGAHVAAPDLRGYGRTTGWDTRYDGNLAAVGLCNLVRDAMALVRALGHEHASMLVGHDFGAMVAPAAALMRPDVFHTVAIMSAPFGGAPALPPLGPPTGPAPALPYSLAAELAALDPPRKHYHWYYSTRGANADMQGAAQGVHDFLRAYYHMKSADWAGNAPFFLAEWSAAELAKLPNYYEMQLQETMAETVAREMPPAAAVAACSWLSEAELRVYSGEYARTGFQGGLQWYRARTAGIHARDLATFAGRVIEVPALFIAGRRDWGVYQKAGDFEAMERACPGLEGCHLVEGAGHWVQQEQAGETGRLLAEFFMAHRRGA